MQFLFDFQLPKTRNYQAPALLCAFKKLKNNDFYVHTKHCRLKHLNNLIKQDHRHVKRRFAKSSGLQNIRHTSRTIKGIKIIQDIYKDKVLNQTPSFLRTKNFTSYSLPLKYCPHLATSLYCFKLCNRTIKKNRCIYGISLSKTRKNTSIIFLNLLNSVSFYSVHLQSMISYKHHFQHSRYLHPFLRHESHH